MGNYQQCVKCILDTKDDPSIHFNEDGICNYCSSYENSYLVNRPSNVVLENQLSTTLKNIQDKGRLDKYDCIMGLSGGVDSSYLALKAMEWGLKPLLVHFDNGWNSELAVQNINCIVEKSGFDLYTYVVDWEEFRDLQLSYILSGVIDWEVPTDHGFYAVLHEQASKNGIKSILAGFNHQTEAILPQNMSWRKQDLANLLDIHKTFGSRKLKSYPLLGFYKYTYYQKVKNMRVYRPLDLIPYNQENAKREIIEHFGWKDYGGKHYESIFTRFYQGYVLPTKYKIDKRHAHLSNLINSGQITKEEALVEASGSPYHDDALFKNDFNFFLKKMEITRGQFEDIISQKPIPHLNYRSYVTGLYPKHEYIFRILNKIRNRRV